MATYDQSKTVPVNPDGSIPIGPAGGGGGSFPVAPALATDGEAGFFTAGAASAAIGAASGYSLGVLVKCNSSSPEVIFINVFHPAAVTSYELAPGDSVELPVASLADIFAISAGGTGTGSWLGVTQ